jgi:hypothetical protein
MGKTYKDFKKDGKVTLSGPKVKERKAFWAGTKTEKPKKGKGSFERKKSYDEDEEEPRKKGEFAKGEKSEIKKQHLRDLRKNNKGISFDPKSVKNKEEDNEERACWKGYKKQGTKKKGGKTVNNCVKESISRFVNSIIDGDHAKAHGYLKKAVQEKLRSRMEKEINTPLFAK